MLDRTTIYDAIYQLAAGDGREKALFGSCAPLAREAFQHSLVAEGFPIIWFEVPFLGEPRFDLHVAFSAKALRKGALLPANFNSTYARVFEWYAHEEIGGNGLAFAYDVSEGSIDAPALHVNVNNAPLENIGRFFELAADERAPQAYQHFTDCMPKDWRVWYAGVHPARPGSHLRVDCFTSSQLRAAYASDPKLLERDLRACGFTAELDALGELTAPIWESPFQLELQFDLMRDGGLGPTIGISVDLPTFARSDAQKHIWKDTARLMDAVERMGLADERWRVAQAATYAIRLPVNGIKLVLYCVPTFIKLRMRDGVPIDAKMYLQASAEY